MTSRRKRLTADLTPGIHGDEWDELLDAIIGELPVITNVRLLIPSEYDTGEARQLLDTLTYVLAKRGVNVDRRHKR
jgi:hypothetical protein